MTAPGLGSGRLGAHRTTGSCHTTERSHDKPPGWNVIVIVNILTIVTIVLVDSTLVDSSRSTVTGDRSTGPLVATPIAAPRASWPVLWALGIPPIEFRGNVCHAGCTVLNLMDFGDLEAPGLSLEAFTRWKDRAGRGNGATAASH
jgi:hypothetical protein